MVDLLKTSHVAAAAAVVFAAFATWIVGGFSHGTALKAIDDTRFVPAAVNRR